MPAIVERGGLQRRSERQFKISLKGHLKEPSRCTFPGYFPKSHGLSIRQWSRSRSRNQCRPSIVCCRLGILVLGPIVPGLRILRLHHLGLHILRRPILRGRVLRRYTTWLHMLGCRIVRGPHIPNHEAPRPGTLPGRPFLALRLPF